MVIVQSSRPFISTSSAKPQLLYQDKDLSRSIPYMWKTRLTSPITLAKQSRISPLNQFNTSKIPNHIGICTGACSVSGSPVTHRHCTNSLNASFCLSQLRWDLSKPTSTSMPPPPQWDGGICGKTAVKPSVCRLRPRKRRIWWPRVAPQSMV